MRIVVIGAGYVGLVSGACLAESGANVVCVDNDRERVEGLVAGRIPFFEPGLDALVIRNVAKGRLSFSYDLGASLQGADVAFIAVGTPPDADGSADVSAVLSVAQAIGSAIAASRGGYVVVVTKSTVPVGTTELVRMTIASTIRDLTGEGANESFDVASNPEFLKEGTAIDDFARPDRIVIGVESDRARAVLERLYRPFLLNNHPVLFMDIRSSEVTKYAANVMLALRISFMNQISALCDAIGADVSDVRRGLATDPRIGPQFLYSGAGYGGSCLPKDVRALSATLANNGLSPDLLRAVEAVNERQKTVAVEKVRRLLGYGPDDSLRDAVIAVWGVAFKPNTDDVRDAPSLTVIRQLVDAGATVRVYDPVAQVPGDLAASVHVSSDGLDAATGCDALVLLTEWPEFRSPDYVKLRKVMRGSVLVDGRNVLSFDDAVAEGFTIEGIGRRPNPTQSTP